MLPGLYGAVKSNNVKHLKEITKEFPSQDLSVLLGDFNYAIDEYAFLLTQVTYLLPTFRKQILD